MYVVNSHHNKVSIEEHSSIVTFVKTGRRKGERGAVPKFPTIPSDNGCWAVAEYVTDCHESGVLSKVIILPAWVLLTVVCILCVPRFLF